MIFHTFNAFSRKKKILSGGIAAAVILLAIILLLPDSDTENQAVSIKSAAAKSMTNDQIPSQQENLLAAGSEKEEPEQIETNPVAENSTIYNKYSIYSYKPLGLKREAGKIDCMIEPYMVVEVASSTSGVVREVLVDRGSYVRKGQVLARLESGVEEANANHAAAKLEFSKKKLEKMRLAYQKKIIPRLKLDETETEHQLAIYEYKRTTELLRLRTIRSPFSGVVVERYISPGELTEQQKVLKIARINPLKVEIIAPIRLHGTVKRGMYAEIWPEGPKKGPYKAKVSIIDRVIDAASGTFGIRLILKNPKHRIPAGVRCQAKFLPMDNKQKAKTVKKKINKPLKLDKRSKITAKSSSVTEQNKQ